MSLHLLSRREGYTRVYTLVYPRVYSCVHACTQPRSKYSLCRGLVCSSLGTNTWTHPEMRLRLSIGCGIILL